MSPEAWRHFLFNILMLTLGARPSCRNHLALSTLRCGAFARAKQAVSGCEMAAFALRFVPFCLPARPLCRRGPARLPLWLQYFNQAGGARPSRYSLRCAARSLETCPPARIGSGPGLCRAPFGRAGTISGAWRRYKKCAAVLPPFMLGIKRNKAQLCSGLTE